MESEEFIKMGDIFTIVKIYMSHFVTRGIQEAYWCCNRSIVRSLINRGDFSAKLEFFIYKTPYLQNAAGTMSKAILATPSGKDFKLLEYPNVKG